MTQFISFDRVAPALCFVAIAALIACSDGTVTEPASAVDTAPEMARASAPAKRSFPVSGTGVHYFSTQIVHSEMPAPGGLTMRSTDIVELDGDIRGFVLYHPTTVIDFGSQTLVNTGSQVFSGTVAGSDPVILYDDTFRFDVSIDPEAPSTVGEIHLGRSLDAPHRGGWFECDLDVIGTGMTPEGDALASYTGTCTEYGNR